MSLNLYALQALNILSMKETAGILENDNTESNESKIVQIVLNIITQTGQRGRITGSTGL